MPSFQLYKCGLLSLTSLQPVFLTKALKTITIKSCPWGPCRAKEGSSKEAIAASQQMA